MAKADRKECGFLLHEIRRHFPAQEGLCRECMICDLFRETKGLFQCAFVSDSGSPVHPKIAWTKRKQRVALLLSAVEVKGVIIPAGEEVLVDRQQNAGSFVWVSVRRQRGQRRWRLGKFLVHGRYLDMDGPLVRTAHGRTVTKIGEYAVYIAGIWFPLHEIRAARDATGKDLPLEKLEVGLQVQWIEIPEWLAQLKGLC